MGDPEAVPSVPPAVVERYEYDPYGRTYIENDDSTVRRAVSKYGNPFAWTGQRYDAGVKLYGFFARAYSPELGRWLQRDPLGFVDGVNLYEYVRSMPTRLTDPLGLAAGYGCAIPPTTSPLDGGDDGGPPDEDGPTAEPCPSEDGESKDDNKPDKEETKDPPEPDKTPELTIEQIIQNLEELKKVCPWLSTWIDQMIQHLIDIMNGNGTPLSPPPPVPPPPPPIEDDDHDYYPLPSDEDMSLEQFLVMAGTFQLPIPQCNDLLPKDQNGYLSPIPEGYTVAWKDGCRGLVKDGSEAARNTGTGIATTLVATGQYLASTPVAAAPVAAVAGVVAAGTGIGVGAAYGINAGTQAATGDTASGWAGNAAGCARGIGTRDTTPVAVGGEMSMHDADANSGILFDLDKPFQNGMRLDARTEQEALECARMLVHDLWAGHFSAVYLFYHEECDCVRPCMWGAAIGPKWHQVDAYRGPCGVTLIRRIRDHVHEPTETDRGVLRGTLTCRRQSGRIAIQVESPHIWEVRLFSGDERPDKLPYRNVFAEHHG
ncbi:MAG: RHS repeat-associated core domain-containing protein [Phycisphaerae bacterium]|nr:RHS repeat-associated core domain-containing protein [Phycisphaerae bacterium]